MALKPLSKKIVERLRDLTIRSALHHGSGAKADKVLGRLPVSDHRFKRIRANMGGSKEPLSNVRVPGQRVRSMRVNGSHGSVVVIKRVHYSDAAETVGAIKKMVSLHNSLVKPEMYALLEPHAYPLRGRLVAMSKTDYPSIEEILGDEKGDSSKITERGTRVFKKLEKKHGISKQDIRTAFRELHRNLDSIQGHYHKYRMSGVMRIDHVWLVGFRGGKFRFLPKIDLI